MKIKYMTIHAEKVASPLTALQLSTECQHHPHLQSNQQQLQAMHSYQSCWCYYTYYV